ncbi:hypothetical protein PV04_01482 [Phialophora macrospora]|uniref:Uncharacterized protein n=1 Tax=Phialophora macrospora TaxID=1851006 RepID=A0A0D2FXX4_9EURO|nr:hypothetical protein PV04_01482 [Phialophora macrospora]
MSRRAGMSLNTSGTVESAPSRAFPNPMRIASILNGPEEGDELERPDFNPEDDVIMLREIINLEGDTDESGCETNSTSSSSSGQQQRRIRQPRPPCKQYNPEQAYFIWYNRTDLGQGWDEVEHRFEIQFGETRKKGGLQCKFYRVLGIHGVEKVREQTKTGHKRRGDRVGKFGVVQRTAKRFSWM